MSRSRLDLRHRRRVLAAVGTVVGLALVASFVLSSLDHPGSHRGGASAAGTSAGSPPPDAGPGDAYAVDCLAVGATVNRQGEDGGPVADLSDFEEALAVLGPLTTRRSFDTTLPATFAESSAQGNEAVGLHSFVSWKPPGGDFRGAAAGAYDDSVRVWAASVPRTGVFATSYHEPENDMSAADFVALQRHLYRVVKEANPTIRWGPVYMAYWWDPGRPRHYVGDPSAWWPGNDHADFAGLDWYSPDPTPMTRSQRFLHWYSHMERTGKPLLITEYGQYALEPGEEPDPAKQATRVRAIETDAEWIAAHPAIRMWLYWHGIGAQGDWRLHDHASQEAWRRVAESGCQEPPGSSGP